MTLIPEGRGIFPSLSVRDNLGIAVRCAPGASDEQRRTALDRIIATFPRLGERLAQAAGTLSGGEQQMLALSRALVAQPRVLMMDEISMGLAPIVVDQLYAVVAAIRADGTTILLVEQYLTHALQFADICYVLAKGEVAFVGEPHELGDAEVVRQYLGVALVASVSRLGRVHPDVGEAVAARRRALHPATGRVLPLGDRRALRVQARVLRDLLLVNAR